MEVDVVLAGKKIYYFSVTNFNLIFKLAQLVLMICNQMHLHLLHRNTTVPT